MKYKNLVITQNAKLFQSIRPILICADLDVSQATTYQKALERLSCFHYVLVVADLSFPDIDGIKLKLLIQAKEENYYELFLLELATGLRLGEIAALQWDDLNPTTGELRINKQAGTVGPEVVICEPKTKAAVRTLILPPTVLKVMREYKAKVDSRWMFPSPKKEDSPMRPSSIHLRLHRILDHAGCERVRFHDLRHTFATNALAYGMDIKTLSTILGHVSSATTLNTYSHVTDEMRQRAAVKIDQGIAKVEVNPQEEKPKERTMTTFQARKRWSRKAS